MHRDVKPANHLFAAQGGLKLVDFGLSGRRDGEPSRGGTIAYMNRMDERNHRRCQTGEALDADAGADPDHLGTCHAAAIQGCTPFGPGRLAGRCLRH